LPVFDRDRVTSRLRCAVNYGAAGRACSGLAVCATGMMRRMGRLLLLVVGGFALVATLAGSGTLEGGAAMAASSAGASSGSGSQPSGTPDVQTLLGPRTLDSPGGIALDTAGDLFVADTGHCRVLVLPDHSGVIDGLRVRAGHVAVLAGGRCGGGGTGATNSMGHPTDVAVDASGDVYVAEATAQRVQEIRRGEGGDGSRGGAAPVLVTVAGTGTAGFNGDGLTGTASELDEPSGVAVDSNGDVFVADTANCRVRVLAAHDGAILGRPVTAGHLTTVAGTGVCGSVGQGGPLTGAELWNPVAVALDPSGDLFVADSGDQSVLVGSVTGTTGWGTKVAAGDLGLVVGGTADYGPYLADGLSATGETAELNDPRGVAVGPTGALYVSDGFMQAVRVVPQTSGRLLGRTMVGGDMYTALGALPVSSPTGLGNGTKWIVTRAGTPTGVAVSSSGALYVSDAALDTVRVIGGAGS
jgi:hypothetical protein